MGQDDEDDAQMLQAKQQITFNVVNKRKDQLRRWQSSEMNAEPARRMKRPKVQFQDSDIFLSACMSGDEEEVEELLLKGADINTCTVDGLTALHQSVIDSKPEMVRFLCEKGADVNAQDNEGWTPLHAAACCGNVSIVRYLCQHGADLSVVNSDKELALDLAVDEQCREYLEDDYKRQMIDLEACREQELATMLKDVKMWISQGEYRDVPHHRTGGTAMHVAAGRGYTQLLELLIKAGGNVRAQDKEGWTPLHAAAHWAERDACKILLENGAELSDLTFTGIDVLGVADKECIDYLVELADTVKSQAKRKSPGSGSMGPPASVLQEKNQRISHSLLHHNPPSSSSTTVTPTPSSTVPSTPTNSNVMAATISSSAKNTPSPAGSVTITATFTKPSRWQSKTVTESEAERRNNSRMQRQHRRSTQGVTKEQLEEASRFATDEVARRNSQVLSSQPTTPTSGGAYSNTLLQPSARLASEEKDLSSYSDDQHAGDVTTSATVSLMNNNNSTPSNSNTNSANVRRKSQGLSISRSNRRATGPVNAEDLAPTMGLRLATAQVPYSTARTAAGTLPTMTTTSSSRLSTSSSEKASSLPPGGGGQTNGITQSTTQSLSSRSAVVAGLSPAPSMRTPIGPLSNTTATSTSSRYMPSSSLSSNGSSANQPIYGLQSRPTETNLNYKALFEKERTECERLRREMDDMRRSQTIEPWRGSSSTQSPAWRTRGASPSATIQNLSVAKSTSLASFDENERRSMERKIADLELQLKTAQNLRMENQRLKEENGALVRVISKMTI